MKNTSPLILIRAFLLAVLAMVALAIVPAARAQSKQLNLYCWSEYVPQTVIDKFTEATGIKVSVENYASNEEMLQKLLGGGNYDLIQPSNYTVEALLKADLLAAISEGSVPNLKNVAPEFRNMDYDPGNKYTVPWMAGHVAIVVNTDKVKDDIKSYNDVFQDKFKKRIVVLDDSRELVAWALATLGINPNDITDENLEKAREILSKWLPLVKVYDSDSPKTPLLNGDVDLGIVWSGEGALLQRESKKFKWIIPTEGADIFVDTLAIPKNAKNKENAEKFMNFILQPEISVLISEDFPYTNPNLEARKLLKPEDLANPASYPSAEDQKKMHFFHDIGTKASDIDALITDLKGS